MKNKVQNIYKIELEKYIQNIKKSKVDIKISRDRFVEKNKVKKNCNVG